MNGSQSLYGNQVRPIFPPYKSQLILIVNWLAGFCMVIMMRKLTVNGLG